MLSEAGQSGFLGEYPTKSSEMTLASETALQKNHHNSNGSRPGLLHRRSGQSSYQQLFVSGAHKKEVKSAPWITSPVKGTEEAWMSPDQEATEWLSLFYDLVVVAVLIVYSTTHELSTPKSIPTLLSFFTISFWLWVSQTNYDMRYQGNDMLNGIIKFGQICLFIYQGAASGNWNPGLIEKLADDPNDFQGVHAGIHDAALTSFYTVTVAFAASRGLLAFQYLLCIFQAKRADRQTKHMFITLVSLLVSLALAVVAAILPATSWNLKAAKIVIFYSGILIEMSDQFLQVLLRINVAIETHKIAERYGAFTIIVLGEGIISVTKAFTKGLSGFSGTDTNTYIQVFLTVLILYLLWAFLFAYSGKHDHTGPGRAVLWQTLHFPLCFGILLLVAAMVNVIINLSSAYGVSLVISNVSGLAINATTPGTMLDPKQIRKASKYINKLSLQPSFSYEFDYINTLSEMETPTEDAYIVFDQYFAQIVLASHKKAGGDIGDGADDAYSEMQSLNATYLTDSDERAALHLQADRLFIKMTNEILRDGFSGILWLLPVSGGVLMMSALRSMLWYHFEGRAHWIVHGPQLAMGFALALLGLLDIGNKNVDITNLTMLAVNPMYRLMYLQLPLVVVAATYLIAFVVIYVSLWWYDRKKRRIGRNGIESGQMIITDGSLSGEHGA